jgi:predicted nucleic acid-binding Zn ribbon protein
MNKICVYKYRCKNCGHKITKVIDDDMNAKYEHVSKYYVIELECSVCGCKKPERDTTKYKDAAYYRFLVKYYKM